MASNNVRRRKTILETSTDKIYAVKIRINSTVKEDSPN